MFFLEIWAFCRKLTEQNPFLTSELKLASQITLRMTMLMIQNEQPQNNNIPFIFML